MGLNKPQLDQIKAFIGKRGFTDIDLQLEILDHLACKVEEKMRTNPHASFEQALQQSHAEFGVLGLSTIEDSMRSAIGSKFRQTASAVCKSWFSIPNILLVIGFTWLLYTTFSRIDSQIAFYGVCFLQLTLIIVTLGYHFRKTTKYKNMLILKSVFPFAYIPILLLQIYLNIAKPLLEKQEFASIVNAIILTGCVALSAFSFHLFKAIQHYALKRCEMLENQYGLIQS